MKPLPLHRAWRNSRHARVATNSRRQRFCCGKGGECNGKQNNDARDEDATTLFKCASQLGRKNKVQCHGGKAKGINSLLEPDTLGQFDEIALALSAQPGVGRRSGGHGDGLD
jgi:hypothetical protein